MEEKGTEDAAGSIDRAELEEEAKKAVDQALTEYQSRTAETEADNEAEQEETENMIQLSSEELAVLANSLIVK